MAGDMGSMVNLGVFYRKRPVRLGVSRGVWYWTAPNLAEQNRPMPSPLLPRILAVVLFMALSPSVALRTAAAHAVIIDSNPAVDAVLAPGDSDVTLHFNSRIDHQRSRLTLITADGRTNGLTIVPDSAADIVAAKLTGLEAGQYRLRWQVLAIDGHLTRGDIRFSVKAP